MMSLVSDHGAQLLGRQALACAHGDVYTRTEQPEREGERPRVRDDAHELAIEHEVLEDLVIASAAARDPQLPNYRCYGRHDHSGAHHAEHEHGGRTPREPRHE